ncbi:MAG: DUF4178 domain-containing protein [Thiolinea sp.]
MRILERDWQVTELNQASCEGFRGELPELITQGEQFDYAHLSGPEAALLTLEYTADASVQAYLGKWVDPFEIRVDI